MKSRRLGLSGAVVLGGAAAAVAACQLIAGIDDRTVWTPDGGDAGFGDAADPCRSVNVPPAPDLSTSSPSDPYDYVAVLSQLHLGVGPDAGGPYGFNLDHTCTCPEKDSCVRGITGDGGKLPPACDEPAGIDNTGRPLFALFAGSNLISEDLLNNSIKAGIVGIFVRIKSYNGQKDDAQVQVAVYSSLGWSGPPDGGPKFDGNDSWLVDNGSVTGGNLDAPRYTTTSGYVRDGTLVATLKFPIIIGSKVLDPIVIELQSGLIVAKLELAGTALAKMTGRLAGRWEASRMLTSLQAVADPLQPTQRLCGSNPTYQAIKPRICEFVDITADPTDDGTGVCNALSMGLGFDAVPAKFGPLRDAGPAATPCGANYTDSCQ